MRITPDSNFRSNGVDLVVLWWLKVGENFEFPLKRGVKNRTTQHHTSTTSYEEGRVSPGGYSAV